MSIEVICKEYKMDKNIEKTKALLLASQEGMTSKERIINDIVDGKVTLLSIDDISERLSISQNIINEWIKNSDPSFEAPKRLHQSLLVKSYEQQIKRSFYRKLYNKDIYFPVPDIYIGLEPRWEKETIKSWLRKCNK